jgi:hypothetical protein
MTNKITHNLNTKAKKTIKLVAMKDLTVGDIVVSVKEFANMPIGSTFIGAFAINDGTWADYSTIICLEDPTCTWSPPYSEEKVFRRLVRGESFNVIVG